MNANVLLLALSQAMLMTSMSLAITASALVGAQLAPDAGLATVPQAVMFLTTMLMMFPASHLMQRMGRRPIFVGGALFGVVGVAIAALGIHTESFLMFTLAGVLIGIYNAVGQYYRFAAVEAVDPSGHSRAISLTLAGGVIAAVIGPNIARFTRDMLQPPFTASFIALIGTTLLAAFFASRLRLPTVSTVAASGEARPLAVIARQPVFLVAVAAAVIGFGAMSLLMTATPLAMHAHHHDFADTAGVIQWHLVAMFAPSFFTGDLIRRFGVLNVIAAGCVFMFACIGVNLLGTSVTHFHIALILLGIGWNFLYVGGTALLTQAYRPAERARVQALNDTLVFSVVAASTLISAGLLSHFSWEKMNVFVAPVIAVVLGATWWLAWQRTKPVPSPAA